MTSDATAERISLGRRILFSRMPNHRWRKGRSTACAKWATFSMLSLRRTRLALRPLTVRLFLSKDELKMLGS